MKRKPAASLKRGKSNQQKRAPTIGIYQLNDWKSSAEWAYTKGKCSGEMGVSKGQMERVKGQWSEVKEESAERKREKNGSTMDEEILCKSFDKCSKA